MKVRINLNNPLLVKAKKLSGIESDKIVIEKALELFVSTKIKN
ncbi:MAG TPA: hypothetical protein VHB54_14235 [Mucilaginibacter sp.]|nr:hypothetical protein [Mucilaginibacter sp.]